MRPLRRVVLVLLVVTFVPLLGQLFRIQILQHRRLQQEALRNFVKVLTLIPSRGAIYDRNGLPLAHYRPGFKVSIVPQKISDAEWDTLRRILNLQVPRDSLKGVGFVTLKSDLSIETVTALEERSDQLPWVIVSPTLIRYYPYGPAFFHPVGYIGRVNRREVEQGYAPDDYVGRMGLERAYEDSLHGTPGIRFVAVDARGRLTRLDPRAPIPPQSGNDLVTTLDAPLQLAVDSLVPDTMQAAVVLLDIRTGEVLVLYAHPGLDPNWFVTGIPFALWDSIRTSSAHPLLNRAVAGRYPPGSTLKPLVGLMGLDLHLITPRERLVTCTGRFRFGDRIWLCWLKTGHGPMNLYQGIAHSCDVYFYALGLKIGLRRFLTLLNSLPLRGPWLRLPEARPGFVPSYEWYRKTYGPYGVTEGLVLNLAIGQGELTLTPLEVATLTGLIAARGRMPAPHLLRRPPHLDTLRLPFAPETYTPIHRAMRQVVTQGTGQAADIPEITVAGKTGTAQNPHGEDHAWFVAFAPYEHPEVALAVLVEHGGHGGSTAAPLAAEILKRYARRRSAP